MTCCNFFFLQNNAKVAVLGAAGGIGQPLSLLLKNSPLVSELSLYDIAHTPGVAADLSHIETRAHVTGMEIILAQQAPSVLIIIFELLVFAEKSGHFLTHYF